MSNIFAPLCRPYGTLPVVLGSGPAVGHTAYMHMLVDDEGLLLCSNDTIHHFGAAIPFDIFGRVVISADPVVRVDQGIPFTASGAVAMVEDPTVARWDQGLTFLVTGHIATGNEPPPATAPIWTTIPSKLSYSYELDEDYPVAPYASSGGEPITSYGLTAPPDFFTINTSTGVINCGVGTAVAAHSITVTATNIVGTTPQSFIWEVITGNVPTWPANTPPDQSHYQNELEPSGQSLDIRPYASSDSGPITSWTLQAPPTGFTINTGIVTVAAGTAVGNYVLTVGAVNGVGVGYTTFDWDILAPQLPPDWHTDIPDQSTEEQLLDVDLDVRPYVDSNSGPLTGWDIDPPVPGFTVVGGIVNAGVSLIPGAYPIIVVVSNDTGTEPSNQFIWTILEEPLPPQWISIDDRADRIDTLPQSYDMDPFVTTNAGPLRDWEINPPVTGFSIDSDGIITVIPK